MKRHGNLFCILLPNLKLRTFCHTFIIVLLHTTDFNLQSDKFFNKFFLKNELRSLRNKVTDL